jgi:hypothetical protein
MDNILEGLKMKKRSIIVVGILVFTIALLTVPLVLAGDGSASFSRNSAAVAADPIEGVQAQGAISLTHSASQAIVAGSVACINSATGYHVDNAYLRRFTLADFGVTGDFAVTDVEVGIESAAAVQGTQPATVNLYAWDPNNAFTYANFTLVATVDVAVPDAALTKMMYPISADFPAGSTLVAEFFTPDGVTAGNTIFIGSNPDGQTDDSFLAAAGCGFADPISVADIGFGDMMIVMNVYGDEVPLVPDMTFDKTVGLDAGSCAATDEISVPAGGGGTDVTYCYSIENTGNVSLTYHTVEDDQLGTVLGPDEMVDIGPGETDYFTATATITGTTVNVATWSVSDGDGTVIISATDTATVTQIPPTSVALSGIEVQSTNWLIPVAFVAIISILFGAAVVLRRRSTI